jgi:hypothetical protein
MPPFAQGIRLATLLVVILPPTFEGKIRLWAARQNIVVHPSII